MCIGCAVMGSPGKERAQNSQRPGAAAVPGDHMLNVLLSFGQFERKVIVERIRRKPKLDQRELSGAFDRT
jgi:hypothetical protein